MREELQKTLNCDCEVEVKHVFFFLQGDLVHQLKQTGASEHEVNKAVAELKARKKVLEAKVRETTG